MDKDLLNKTTMTRVTKKPAPMLAFFSLDQKRKDWTYRRIVIFGVLFACLIWITWAAGWMRVETAQTMLANGFNCLMVIVTGYVFGGIWDDHLKGKKQVEMGGGFEQHVEEHVDVNEHAVRRTPRDEDRDDGSDTPDRNASPDTTTPKAAGNEPPIISRNAQ